MTALTFMALYFQLFLIELLEWGYTFVSFLGERKLWQVRIHKQEDS